MVKFRTHFFLIFCGEGDEDKGQNYYRDLKTFHTMKITNIFFDVDSSRRFALQKEKEKKKFFKMEIDDKIINEEVKRLFFTLHFFEVPIAISYRTHFLRGGGDGGSSLLRL